MKKLQDSPVASGDAGKSKLRDTHIDNEREGEKKKRQFVNMDSETKESGFC